MDEQEDTFPISAQITMMVSAILFNTFVKNGVQAWDGFEASIKEGIHEAEGFFGIPEGALTFDTKVPSNNNNKT